MNEKISISIVMKNNYLSIIKVVVLRNFAIFFYMEEISRHEGLVGPELCVN